MKTTTDPKTESTHTPGPWRIGDNFSTIFGPKSEHPAPVTIANLPLATARVSSEERHANACLIAAAPELLALLEEVTGALEKLAFPRGVKKAYSEMVVAASARKLIAKAKGEIL